MGSRRTALYESHLAAGARMVDFSGWEMPLQYSSVREEHLAVRTSAGLFDVSHMGRFSILGDGIPPFLDRLLTGRLSDLGSARARYTLMCDLEGGIVDDLVVYRDPEGGWHCVVNAGNRSTDLDWMRGHAPDPVSLIDRSDEVGLLALQGPSAAAILRAAGGDLEHLPYFALARAPVGSVPMLVSRTGYTGEDGFELFVPTPQLPRVWDVLIDHGAVPCGLAARDVCRLEAGLRLHGSDMGRDTDPLEVGLGWTVKLDKPDDFVGRSALERKRREGPRREMVGLLGLGRSIPRHGAGVGGEPPLGLVTSGTYSFWLNRGIGMALVRVGSTRVGDLISMDVRGVPGQVEVASLPLYRGSVGSLSGGAASRPSKNSSA